MNNCIFAGNRRRKSSSASSSSKISTHELHNIVNRLLLTQHKDSTAKTYLSVWRQFNKFLIMLDDTQPVLWEDRTTLFIAHLVDQGLQSSTIKSYVSAIKKTLIMDGYKWDDNLVMVRSLAKACRIINDKMRTRLPIQCNLLELLLFEIRRHFSLKNQWYLEILYQTLFALSYYGLMRVSEVAKSPHVLKAKNVHIASNKDKLLLVLYSSKTHDEASKPQKIKITSNRQGNSNYSHRHFCPFVLMRQFLHLRGDYDAESEQFFIFRDKSSVLPSQCRNLLKLMISKLGLDDRLYGMHSFRIGRTTDLVKFKYSIDEIKLMGRWRSNVVFKYIKQ